MTTLEEFRSRLDPKTAKRIKTAQETEVERLPVISEGMTDALGGGIAKGRITLTYGNQSAGKSLVWQETIGKIWQPMGLVCAYVDTEGAYDKEWGAKLGIDNDQLVLIESKSSGRIEEEITPLLRAEIDVIVIDSISDIMPETFIGKDGQMNAQVDRKQLGAHAKAITALVNGILYENKNTAVVLISQTTTQIEQTYVKQVPHGGKKVLFAASQIIKLTSSNTDAKQIKGEHWIGDMVFEEPIGRKVDGLVEKNKLGKQHGTFEYDMYYGGKNVGIDTFAEIIDRAIKYDVIVKGGAWFKFDGQQWQGRDNLVAAMREEPELVSKVKAEIALRLTGEIIEQPVEG